MMYKIFNTNVLRRQVSKETEDLILGFGVLALVAIGVAFIILGIHKANLSERYIFFLQIFLFALIGTGGFYAALDVDVIIKEGAPEFRSFTKPKTKIVLLVVIILAVILVATELIS